MKPRTRLVSFRSTLLNSHIHSTQHTSNQNNNDHQHIFASTRVAFFVLLKSHHRNTRPFWTTRSFAFRARNTSDPAAAAVPNAAAPAAAAAEKQQQLVADDDALLRSDTAYVV